MFTGGDQLQQYDNQIIQKFSDDLYVRAHNIVVMWTFYGCILGGVGGLLAGLAIYRIPELVGFFIGALIAALLGNRMGTRRAFHLRLEAQLALCQVQIELNTRDSHQYIPPRES